ncbi:MAG TPA: metallopeptidase family protein [Planctomycetota bacterium]|nr:metallopeptidase family protein [Planctomycetota bacterium]
MDELDAILDRIEELYSAGDEAGARKLVKKTRKRHPEELMLAEWEAVFAADEGLYDDALRVLDEVLGKEPDRPFALHERAKSLFELWRFDEGIPQLEAILRDRLIDDDPLAEAEVRFDLACALDHEGRTDEADRQFQLAAKQAPDDFPVPARGSRREFEAMVLRSLEAIPAQLRTYLDQVSIVVQNYPPRSAPGPYLLGLYEGLPRTQRLHDDRDHLDSVFIFQRNHETLNLPPEELEDEVRRTVIHEVAHHFGLGEDDMGEYA